MALLYLFLLLKPYDVLSLLLVGSEKKMKKSNKNLIIVGFIFSFILFLFTQKAFATIDIELGIGSRGNEVMKLQQFLATNPIVYPEGIISNYFGSLTEDAVVRFQKFYSLPLTGRVDLKTQTKINSIMSSDIDLSSDDLDSQLLTMQGLQPDRPYYYYYLTQAINRSQLLVH